MLVLRGSDHIRTHRNIKGQGSRVASSGPPSALADRGRICREDAAMAGRELRRAWLARLWRQHLDRCRRSRAN